MNPSITKIQDCDGHWYWIPNDELEDFEADNRALDGLDYMDNPDAFDAFESNWGHYRTGGDINNTPRHFKE